MRLKYLGCLVLAALVAVSGGTIAAQRASGNSAASAVEPDGTTPLHRAVHGNDLKTADALIRSGADVNAVNRYGVPPLSLAATNGNPAILELLLKAGANPNATQSEGETALMTAARTGIRRRSRHCSRTAPSPPRRRAGAGRARDVGCRRRTRERIQVLLEAGAQINARSNAGWTALLVAAREGRIPAVKTLLAGGADVDDALVARRAAGTRRRRGGPGPDRQTRGSRRAGARGRQRPLRAGCGAPRRGRKSERGRRRAGRRSSHTWIRKPGTGSNDSCALRVRQHGQPDACQEAEGAPEQM